MKLMDIFFGAMYRASNFLCLHLNPAARRDIRALDAAVTDLEKREQALRETLEHAAEAGEFDKQSPGVSYH